jgi:nucleoside-diphosphate-sugar epimerase
MSAGDATGETKRRVLITGAGGRIGGHLAESLRDRYDLRLHYFRTMPERPPVADWIRADIAEYDQIAPALDGIDAVVHLAAEPSPMAPWEQIHRQNVVGTYNVFEAARAAGVRRVVFASTNHVMGMYDRDQAWPIHGAQPVRPDSLYGVSKAFGENLGRYYYDQHGLSVVCLRIGWFLTEPMDEYSRMAWLSPRDCTQVVERSIEADLGFGIFYAISANGRRRWDITDTIYHLGYQPEDDAERVFPDGAPSSHVPPGDLSGRPG